MTTYLVAGATGELGRATLQELERRGLDVRRLSRSAGVAADLLTGRGVAEALEGVDVVLHCATTNGPKDVAMAENLVAAARSAGVRHLVLISIVGIEKVPWSFYRDRVRIEEIVRGGGIPFTIQRATQFHSFVVNRFLEPQRRLPVLLAPAVQVQSIAVEDIAVRLADLAVAEPRGRAEDIGGPEVLAAAEVAHRWATAAGLRRRVVPVRLPGRVFAAFAAGVNLVPGAPYGTRTLDEYLAERYGAEVPSARS